MPKKTISSLLSLETLKLPQGQFFFLEKGEKPLKLFQDEIARKIKEHYISLTLSKNPSISENLQKLKFKTLSERLPRKIRIQSGDLGELICTELIEELSKFTIPIRKLSYKDHREMALRGDDAIGIFCNDTGVVQLLKAEAKSRASLDKTTINRARSALYSNLGKPSAHTLIYIADKLEREGKDDLALKIYEIADGISSYSQDNITHCIFTFAGNNQRRNLISDFKSNTSPNQLSINLFLDDHQQIIKSVYSMANNEK